MLQLLKFFLTPFVLQILNSLLKKLKMHLGLHVFKKIYEKQYLFFYPNNKHITGTEWSQTRFPKWPGELDGQVHLVTPLVKSTWRPRWSSIPGDLVGQVYLATSLVMSMTSCSSGLSPSDINVLWRSCSNNNGGTK